MAQLAAVLTEAPLPSLNHQFVETFVRPHGLELAATPIFVDAIEHLAGQRRLPASPTQWAHGLRVVLWPVAWLLSETGNTEKIWQRTRNSQRRAAWTATKEARKAASQDRITIHRERKRAADQRRKRRTRWREEIRHRWRSLFFPKAS
jgi:hypothetical protein